MNGSSDVLKWSIRIGGALLVLLAGLFWWLLLSGSDATKTATGLFDLADWQSKASAPTAQLPTEIRVLEIGRDKAPAFAVQAGRFGAGVDMSYNAVEIVYPDRTIMVGGAVDRMTAETMTTSKPDWRFSDAAYATLLNGLVAADQVVITHEHLDHVMAIARHPNPELLAPNLMLNRWQIAALPQFAIETLDPALRALPARLSGEVESIAPGLVIVPAAGHTKGSQNIFVQLQNGEEILLIGDIVWNVQAIDELKTRPVLTQYLIFRPDYEDRAAIKEQVRALHDLRAVHPDLHVLPAHDRAELIAAAEIEGISFLPAE
jgi:glyoxylase-like metal-dependent hydrolase (beta-lactamase superfamily II)